MTQTLMVAEATINEQEVEREELTERVVELEKQKGQVQRTSATLNSAITFRRATRRDANEYLDKMDERQEMMEQAEEPDE